MTFNEIEKEYWETFDINQGTDKINGYPVIKINDTYSRPATVEDFESFLKQSFIKYLQSQIRFMESKYEYDTSIYDGSPFRIENERTEVIDEIVDNLQAQIKELEV